MIDFKKLTFRDNPETLLDSELRVKVLDLNLTLVEISNILYDFDSKGASKKFNREVNRIRERVRYLHMVTDACTNYNQISNVEPHLKMAMLGAIYACDDFYYCNDKTLATINKYLKKP